MSPQDCPSSPDTSRFLKTIEPLGRQPQGRGQRQLRLRRRLQEASSPSSSVGVPGSTGCRVAAEHFTRPSPHGASARLRAGRAYRRLPLAASKHTVPGTLPLRVPGCCLPASSGTASDAPGQTSASRGETVALAHAIIATGIHRLAGVPVRGHHLTGRQGNNTLSIHRLRAGV